MHKKNDSSNSTKELIKGDNHSHLSTITKIKNFDKILKPREKFIVYIATLFFILAIIGGSVKYYLSATEAIPTIGGEYIAGIPIDSEGLPTTIIPI
jgi:hypothetical protein